MLVKEITFHSQEYTEDDPIMSKWRLNIHMHGHVYSLFPIKSFCGKQII
jgi:hypothetical protein